jgi:ABC-type phosphonate transport system ATPase subunit
MRSTIAMAREAGWTSYDSQDERFKTLVELARADEREAIMEEWWMCVQSDLENGVKSLNEQAAAKWRKEYPEIAKFGAWLNDRGETKCTN